MKQLIWEGVDIHEKSAEPQPLAAGYSIFYNDSAPVEKMRTTKFVLKMKNTKTSRKVISILLLCSFISLIPFTSSEGSAGTSNSQKPWIGVFVLQHDPGVLIDSTVKGSPAEKAGLRENDIIIKINNRTFDTLKGFLQLLQPLKVGQTIDVTYIRNGITSTAKLKTASRPGSLDIVTKDLEGHPAPMFKLPTIWGENSGNLNDYRGRIVLLQFWASWCPVCRVSHIQLNKMASRYKHKKVVILSITNEQGPKIKSYLNRIKPNFPVLLDRKGSVFHRYGVTSVPTFAIVNARGIVEKTAIGGGKTLDHLTVLLDEMLYSEL